MDDVSGGNAEQRRLNSDSEKCLAVLVLGMHRSGTSALCGVLNLLGIAVPGDLMPPTKDNQKGYFENQHVAAFHDMLLSRLRSRWDDPLPLSTAWLDSPMGIGLTRDLEGLIQREFGHESAFLVKDPRMCRLVPLWVEALDRLNRRAVAVQIFRHPLEVARSLERRDGLSEAQSLMLWLEHVLSTEIATRELPRTFVSYEALLRNWRSVVRRIADELAMTYPLDIVRVEVDIDQFLSAELRHQVAVSAEVDGDTPFRRLISDVWAALARLEINPRDPEAEEMLNRARFQLDDATSVFAPLVIASQNRVDELQNALAGEKHAAHTALVEADRLLQSELAHANQLRQDESERGAGNLARANQLRQEELARSEDALAHAQRLWQQETARVSHALSTIEHLKGTIEHLKGEHDSRLSHIEHLRQQSDVREMLTAAKLMEADRQLAALLQSTSWKLTQPLRKTIGVHPMMTIAVRRAVKLTWWTLTGQLVSRTRLASERLSRAGENISFNGAKTRGTPLRKLGTAASRLVFWIATPFRMPGRLETIRTLGRKNRRGFFRNAFTALSSDVEPSPTPLPSSTELTGYDRWVEQFDTLSEGDRVAIDAHLKQLSLHPLISVIVPVYNTPIDVLTEMIRSVKNQVYTNWELCIADDCSPDRRVAKALKKFAQSDRRIKFARRNENGHIAAASNTALTLATGEFVALLDHDDLLSDHALYEIVVELNRFPDADIVYSDEDKTDGVRRFEPYFKTDFSLDLLLGQNMVSHLGVYRKALIDKIGGFRVGFEGSQDYDLTLRAVANTELKKIRHIPAVLYHWRQTLGGESFSQAQIDRCILAGQRAVSNFISEAGLEGTVTRASALSQYNRVHWALPDPAPLVSIIIPTRDRVELLRTCLAGILQRTNYPNFEIIIVDNESREPETIEFFAELVSDSRVHVRSVQGPFNYSHLNNEAARQARGEILLLLNNDIDVIEPGWLTEMVSLLGRQDVAIVGAKLLYADGRMQHAGVRLGAGHFDGGPGVAGHLGMLSGRDDPGYFGLFALTRDVGAVTGACLAIRRSVFDELGGLDEVNLKVAFNDVDICLRAREAGYRILWTPFAELYHLESASRGSDDAPEKRDRFWSECHYILDRWEKELRSDPFYNPTFDNYEKDFQLANPPRREKPWLSFLPSAQK